MFIQQSRFKLKNVCNTILFKSLCDLVLNLRLSMVLNNLADFFVVREYLNLY
jgi:hypothetical protein